MASKPRLKGTRWEVVFKRAGILDKPLYVYYPTEEAALRASPLVDKLLAKGIIPDTYTTPSVVMTLESLLELFKRDAHPSQKDREILRTVIKAKGQTPVGSIDIKWADDWITEMKREQKLVPSSIRAKIGAVARAWHWAQRKDHINATSNPFRGMGEGYANYTELDAKFAGEAKKDQERDRRLEPGEEAATLAVIRNGVLPRKLRPYTIPHPTDLERDFVLALETAMRLRERYTLEVQQVRLHHRTIYLDRTKNGDSRNVPLSSVAVAMLTEQIKDKHPSDRVFPWWDGDNSTKALKHTSNFLSKLYAQIFEVAGCGDLREHDLRHEATSRFFERTQLPGEAVMKITGHKSHAMLMRYLSLRGSDLAQHLW